MRLGRNPCWPSDGKTGLNRFDTFGNRPPEYDWRNDPAFAPEQRSAPATQPQQPHTQPQQPQVQPVQPHQARPQSAQPQQSRQPVPPVHPAELHRPAQPVHPPVQQVRQPAQSADPAPAPRHLQQPPRQIHPQNRPQPHARSPERASERALPPGRDGVRSLAEFEKARRHSQRVRFLRKALPYGGAGVLIAMIVVFAASFFSGPSIDLGEARFEDGKLVMRNPALNGTDENSRPYNLTADKAIQDTDAPSRIHLQGINGKLPMTDTEFAVVQAGNGTYDADAKTLLLGGKVAVDTDNGMAIRMEDADIDIGTGSMHTTNPVSVDTGRAKVTADSLTVSENGERIVFENRVRMTLMPAGEEAVALRPAQPVVKE